MIQHRHLIIRAECRRPPTDANFITNWLADLIQAINMKILLGPYAVYCDKVGNRGLTAIVAIETSHIVMHTWDEQKPNTIQFDCYTCSDLDVDTIIKKLAQFECTKIEYKYLDREHNLTEVQNAVVNYSASARPSMLTDAARTELMDRAKVMALNL